MQSDSCAFRSLTCSLKLAPSAFARFNSVFSASIRLMNSLWRATSTSYSWLRFSRATASCALFDVNMLKLARMLVN